MKIRSQFTVARVAETYVAIIDQDKGLSVTNDAEAVVAYLLRNYSAKQRFYYRDTTGRWDELSHDGRQFNGYAPLPAELQNELAQLESS